MSEATFIYGLFDPRNYRLRYIGKANNPKARLSSHIHWARTSKRNQHNYNWIKQLLREGLRPELEILEEVPIDKWEEAESAWISDARKFGLDLTNRTNGGEGPNGVEFTAERRKQISDRMKGRPTSEYQRSRIIEYNKTRIISDEMKKKISEANKGNSYAKGTKKSDESKLKMRNAKLGKKMSEEAKEKMRKNNSGENNPNFGKVHSDEARGKMRQAQLGRKHTEEHRLKNSLGLKKAYREGRR